MAQNVRSARLVPVATRKVKRTLSTAQVHVFASFNNTIVTITDTQGNAICWGSAGSAGFKGSRKSILPSPPGLAAAAGHQGCPVDGRSADLFDEAVTHEKTTLGNFPLTVVHRNDISILDEKGGHTIAKLSDNFIIVRQVENVKWKFVTNCYLQSTGNNSSGYALFHRNFPCPKALRTRWEQDGSYMGATWAEHGSYRGRDVEPCGASVELPWTYCGATCQLVTGKKDVK